MRYVLWNGSPESLAQVRELAKFYKIEPLICHESHEAGKADLILEFPSQQGTQLKLAQKGNYVVFLFGDNTEIKVLSKEMLVQVLQAALEEAERRIRELYLRLHQPELHKAQQKIKKPWKNTLVWVWAVVAVVFLCTPIILRIKAPFWKIFVIDILFFSVAVYAGMKSFMELVKGEILRYLQKKAQASGHSPQA